MNASVQTQKFETPKIAIVGMAAMFPGEGGTTGFWRTIARGEDTIGDVPPHYWRVEDYYDPDPSAPDKTYCRRGGFLEKVPFDTLRFGVPPSVMSATDTAQLLALITASEVLDGVAKSQKAPLDKSRTGVVLGVASATELCVHMGSRLQRPIWANALREAGLPEDQVTALCDRISDHFVPWQEASFPGLLGNVVAGRIANRLDLGGANFVTDAACASSLSALQVGLSQLYLGEADLVVTGGVDALNDILMFMCFSKTPAFSQSGDCRPFSDQADGTILGEGVAMFALRRLEDAERDGNDIYAVICGMGAASDGRATSVYAPRPEGQALAIERAYAAAGFDPSTVGLVEAHGTGTKAGDAAEFGGLRRVFGAARTDRQWCALGSVKSQIGHTKAAAGGAGLFKAAMALHHRVMPPTLKVERPNPALKVEESPFYLNTELRPWISSAAHPRRAAVSSFGFGGSNFHVALEEYRGKAKPAPKRRHHDSELVLVSAATPAELERSLAGIVARAAAVDLSLVAFESQMRFDARHACRLSLPVTSTAQLAEAVAAVRSAIGGNTRPGPIPGGGRLDLGPAQAGRLALLFPGQGSQYVGMGGAVATAFEAARQVWDRAAGAVRVDDAPLHDVVFPPPAFTAEARAEQEARLTRMSVAQPAISVAEAAMLAVLDTLGVRGDCFAGHSFGEVMALHAAGSYGVDAAFGIATERGRLMSAAASSTDGAMIAVAAGHDTVARLVATLRLDVVVANDNSPQQVVLSGTRAAVVAAAAALRQHGLNVTELPVATGFHSPIVSASCGPFRSFLEAAGVSAPQRAVYANATAAPYSAAAGDAAKLLAAQLGDAVRFRETIERMYADGVRTFVEVGPGSVLTGLVRQCLGDRPHRAVALDRKSVKGLAAFWSGIGELALAGIPVDLRALWHEAPAEPEAKRPSGAHVFEISGVNVGKPFPARAAAPAEAGTRAAVAPHPVAAPASEPAVVVADAAGTSRHEQFAAFQARLDDQQKHIEATLLDAHRSYMETSKAAFLAVFGTAGAAEPVILPAELPIDLPPPVQPEQTVAMAPPVAPLPPVIPSPSLAVVAPAPAADTSLLRLVEAVVAEKTGYPAEVLGADMDLEAELGIDSIKQVEILSALREKMPGLPELEPSALARFRTIGMIAQMLAGHAAPADTPPAEQPAAATVATPAVVPTPAAPVAAPADDTSLLRLVEAVVAEKTGYPAEVLGADMDLEAELGIDSIKQVEILSALREKMPGLPELEPSALARFRTIGMIAQMLAGHAAPADTPPAEQPAAATVATPAVVPTPAAPVAAPAGDTSLLRLVEAVVAEKTGYPAEVLGADMDLEAELGIDSIKQVEILSALREKMPGLPELEPSALARFRTIGMIAQMLAGHAAPADTPPAVQPAAATVATPAVVPTPAAPVAAPADDTSLLRLVEAVVAEKTGYPAEVLGADMDLEAELGIDSIKQVEILSALREKMPGLPELEPSALARFRTIGMIAQMLAGHAAPADTPPDPPGATAPIPRAPVLAAPVAKAATNPLLRQVCTFVESPLAGMMPPALAQARTASLVGGPAELVAALVGLFKARGIAATAAAAGATDGDVVLFLDGLAGGSAPCHALDVQRNAFLAAKAAATRQGRVFVTVQDGAAWSGGLAGLVKTAAREWPDAAVKAIDIAAAGRSAIESARLIVSEIFAGGPDIEVAYDAADVRRVPVRGRRPLGGLTGLPLDDGDVVVISGGARGVTAAAALALAEEKRLRFCLLGRTAPVAEAPGLAGAMDEVAIRQRLGARAMAAGQRPDLPAIRREAARILAGREIARTFDGIRSLGSEARYLTCDVNDAAAVSAAMSELRRSWGPIAGLIHGAGIIADKAIAEKSVADFDAVFSTKVGGWTNLLQAVDQDRLKLLCNFSSVSAKFGNAGQSDYAMANETLNRLAIDHARSHPGCRVKSICWGPWAGGMVDGALKQHFARAGIGLIDLAAGARALVEELSSDDGAVEVILSEGDFLPDGGIRMTVEVNPADHGFLVDHRIAADPVLPVVMVQDWFARLARGRSPAASSVEIEDLQVLKGVELHGFPARSFRFDIELTPRAAPDGGFEATLRDEQGQLRYAARIAAGNGTSGPAVAAVPGSTGIAATARPYADGRLFHGPAFQTIERFDLGAGSDATAVIGTTAGRAWPGAGWAADPAALDGCLQLARLWTYERGGYPSLPSRIGRCRVLNQAAPGQSYVCRMRSRVVDSLRTDHDIELLLDGRPAIVLSGVQMYRTAKAAFAA